MHAISIMSKPISSFICDLHQHQYDRNLHQNTDGRGQGRGAGGAEQGDRHGDVQFKEVGRSDHFCGSRDIIGRLEQLAGEVGQKENKEYLNDQRHRGQYNVQRIFQNYLTLEHKDEYQRQQKADGGHRIELVNKGVLKIIQPLFLHDCHPGQNAPANKQDHSEDQRIKGKGHIGEPQQELDNRDKGHQDNEVIVDNLEPPCRSDFLWLTCSRQTPSLCRTPPPAGYAGQIFTRQFRRDKRLKYREKEREGDAIHGKGLDHPVDDPGHKQSLWIPAILADTLEVYFHHHGIDHYPDQDCHGD